ncbi:MAG: hypothetical protein VX730_07200 [Pseudomonadota bacterium]|nr:hypothetical protein [Pseudomonadota bacterium]
MKHLLFALAAFGLLTACDTSTKQDAQQIHISGPATVSEEDPVRTFLKVKFAHVQYCVQTFGVETACTMARSGHMPQDAEAIYAELKRLAKAPNESFQQFLVEGPQELTQPGQVQTYARYHVDGLEGSTLHKVWHVILASDEGTTITKDVYSFSVHGVKDLSRGERKAINRQVGANITAAVQALQ